MSDKVSVAIELTAHSFRPAPGGWRATARARDDGIAIAAIGARVCVKTKAELARLLRLRGVANGDNVCAVASYLCNRPSLCKRTGVAGRGHDRTWGNHWGIDRRWRRRVRAR